MQQFFTQRTHSFGDLSDVSYNTVQVLLKLQDLDVSKVLGSKRIIRSNFNTSLDLLQWKHKKDTSVSLENVYICAFSLDFYFDFCARRSLLDIDCVNTKTTIQ
ncbi:hypothetical protein AQUCO_00700356v1 [Aquilegia coerulea]|uniref:Uncharacterized protein n=1 Tax=Aquilegia coerulea TaxID=218851 RepID=A0A2G5EJP3_AQUCA|nr:hypothetical protein AQUCO_00700356v1 [Aquilegia coerulea]